MGKLGIVLAFLLSVAAAGGSYYLYQGLVEERTARSNIEAKYDQVKEKMITVQSEKEQITAKSEEYRTKAEAMQAQTEQLQAEQKRIDTEKAALEKQLQSRQAMITELQGKMADLEKKAKEAQAACSVTPADLKSDPLASAQAFTEPATSVPSTSTATEAGAGTTQLIFKPMTPGAASTVTRMPSPVKEAPAIVASPSTETSTATMTAEPAKSSEAPATAVESSGAKVLTVNRKFNFVVVNQGLQQGLKMGDKLQVVKDGKEIATVQVEKLYDKFSAATLVEEDPKQQVVEGDEIRKI